MSEKIKMQVNEEIFAKLGDLPLPIKLLIHYEETGWKIWKRFVETNYPRILQPNWLLSNSIMDGLVERTVYTPEDRQMYSYIIEYKPIMRYQKTTAKYFVLELEAQLSLNKIQEFEADKVLARRLKDVLPKDFKNKDLHIDFIKENVTSDEDYRLYGTVRETLFDTELEIYVE